MGENWAIIETFKQRAKIWLVGGGVRLIDDDMVHVASWMYTSTTGHSKVCQMTRGVHPDFVFAYGE